jgi:hypothetical protein
MQNQIVHGQDSLRNSFFIHDGQAPNVLVPHDVESFVHVIVWFAGEDLRDSDFADRELAGQQIPRAHGNANVAISDYADQFSLVIDHWEHAHVSIPHEFNSSADICFWTATNSCGHSFFDFHSGSPRFGPPGEYIDGESCGALSVSLEGIFFEQPVMPAACFVELLWELALG